MFWWSGFQLIIPSFFPSLSSSHPSNNPAIHCIYLLSIYRCIDLSIIHHLSLLYICTYISFSSDQSRIASPKVFFLILFYRYKIFALCNSLEVTCSTYNVGVPLLLMHFGDYFGTDWSPDLAGGGALREFVI